MHHTGNTSLAKVQYLNLLHPLRERPPPEKPTDNNYNCDLSLYLDADMFITQIQNLNYLKFWICYGKKIQNLLETFDPDGTSTINELNDWSSEHEVQIIILERVLPVAEVINKKIVNLKTEGKPTFCFSFLKS